MSDTTKGRTPAPGLQGLAEFWDARPGSEGTFRFVIYDTGAAVEIAFLDIPAPSYYENSQTWNARTRADQEATIRGWIQRHKAEDHLAGAADSPVRPIAARTSSRDFPAIN
jgi:hypothetical protein